MVQKDRELTMQWAQLGALAAIHFLADVFPGMMHSVLPAVQEEFTLDYGEGAMLLVAFNLSSNWVQVFTGHLRAARTRPLFMYLGLMFATMICLWAVLPRSVDSLNMMVVLALISGAGVAIIHPEALRAIHSLDRISSATSTSVFMVGGILGFALGGKYSTDLVAYFGGVRGLFPLAVCPVACIIVLVLLKIRLAVEKPELTEGERENKGGLSFWPILVMTTLAGISSATIVWIVPQRLAHAGLELTFGGYSVMMFSLGGGLGAFFWAAAGERFGDILCAMFAILLGIPLMLAYAFLIDHKPAVWLFFAGSFCAFGCYPLMVSIARGTTGPRLGQRMAFMVGGSWGIACLFPIFLAPMAERFGFDRVLLLSPAGYVLACVTAVLIMLKIRAFDTRAVSVRAR
jgi:MFS family permease